LEKQITDLRGDVDTRFNLLDERDRHQFRPMLE